VVLECKSIKAMTHVISGLVRGYGPIDCAGAILTLSKITLNYWSGEFGVY